MGKVMDHNVKRTENLGNPSLVLRPFFLKARYESFLL